MVDCQGRLTRSTISALMTVTTDNVLAGQFHLTERESNVREEAYNARIGIDRGDSAQPNIGAGLYHLGLPQPEKYDSFTDIADTQWLVVLVEDQNLLAHCCTGMG